VQMLRALLDGHPVAQASRLHPSRSVPNLQGLRKINQIKKNIHTKVHKNLSKPDEEAACRAMAARRTRARDTRFKMKCNVEVGLEFSSPSTRCPLLPLSGCRNEHTSTEIERGIILWPSFSICKSSASWRSWRIVNAASGRCCRVPERTSRKSYPPFQQYST
jgi:hypothetical protein